jgi:poly(3-hydroxybutyrate) depolymerase
MLAPTKETHARMVAYAFHDFSRFMLSPAVAWADLARQMLDHPWMPFRDEPPARLMAAGAAVFGDAVRRRGRPEWGLPGVATQRLFGNPFHGIVRFAHDQAKPDAPRVLVAAPMSGHFPTLLRGTVAALLPDHDVHITDWADARDVPEAAGSFGLEEYIAALIVAMRALGPDLHVVAVCQPAPLVLAAAALMAANEPASAPRSLVLMGGPVDVRAAPTVPTRLAAEKPLEWFRRNCVGRVPAAYAGAGRAVYPGFVQLAAFMAMNASRHVKAHMDQFLHLVRGDGDSAAQHNRFYDEYLSVMDIPAEFYLQTIDQVFQQSLLPRGLMTWRDEKVELRAISRTGLMTVEGGADDISAPGQTFAAHMLCPGIGLDQRRHHLEDGVGHYGIFNGRRWRESIMPAVAEFIRRA